MQVKAVLVFLLLFPFLSSLGQNQLVLLSRERVLARFTYGDDFTYKLKNSKHYKSSFITVVNEFSIVTFNDTILFSAIDRISLKGHPQKRFRLISQFLITAGVAYFALDQVNNILIKGNKPDLEPTVWKPSLVLVTAGCVLKLLHKRSQRIRYPARLLAAGRGSLFYKSDQ